MVVVRENTFIYNIFVVPIFFIHFFSFLKRLIKIISSAAYYLCCIIVRIIYELIIIVAKLDSFWFGGDDLHFGHCRGRGGGEHSDHHCSIVCQPVCFYHSEATKCTRLLTLVQPPQLSVGYIMVLLSKVYSEMKVPFLTRKYIFFIRYVFLFDLSLVNQDRIKSIVANLTVFIWAKAWANAV